jgi:hypothetical protein
MNKLYTFLIALGLGSCAFADTFTLDAVNGGAATGSPLVNFDDLMLNNSPQTAGAISISFTGTAKATTGSVMNEYAAPFLSGNNGLGFGNPGNQPDGLDTTTYLSSGTGTLTFEFAIGQKYLGLLWGSVDDYNTLQFYDGDELLQTYTGLDVWDSANGDRGAQGTFYVNINNLDGTFNRVVASSSTNSFEIDNMAHSTENHVPDSGTTVTLMGLALVGLAALRRLF